MNLHRICALVIAAAWLCQSQSAPQCTPGFTTTATNGPFILKLAGGDDTDTRHFYFSWCSLKSYSSCTTQAYVSVLSWDGTTCAQSYTVWQGGMYVDPTMKHNDSVQYFVSTADGLSLLNVSIRCDRSMSDGSVLPDGNETYTKAQNSISVTLKSYDACYDYTAQPTQSPTPAPTPAPTISPGPSPSCAAGFTSLTNNQFILKPSNGGNSAYFEFSWCNVASRVPCSTTPAYVNMHDANVCLKSYSAWIGGMYIDPTQKHNDSVQYFVSTVDGSLLNVSIRCDRSMQGGEVSPDTDNTYNVSQDGSSISIKLKSYNACFDYTPIPTSPAPTTTSPAPTPPLTPIPVTCTPGFTGLPQRRCEMFPIIDYVPSLTSDSISFFWCTLGTNGGKCPSAYVQIESGNGCVGSYSYWLSGMASSTTDNVATLNYQAATPYAPFDDLVNITITCDDKMQPDEVKCYDNYTVITGVRNIALKSKNACPGATVVPTPTTSTPTPSTSTPTPTTPPPGPSNDPNMHCLSSFANLPARTCEASAGGGISTLFDLKWCKFAIGCDTDFAALATTQSGNTCVKYTSVVSAMAYSEPLNSVTYVVAGATGDVLNVTISCDENGATDEIKCPDTFTVAGGRSTIVLRSRNACLNSTSSPTAPPTAPPPPPADTGSSGGLTPGAKAGITFAVIFVVGCTVGYMLYYKGYIGGPKYQGINDETMLRRDDAPSGTSAGGTFA